MQTKKQKQKQKTRDTVLMSLLMAMITLQTWVPLLGYIPVSLLSITIIQVTVIVGVTILGTRRGTLLGLTWGLNSYLRSVLIGSPIDKLIMMDIRIAVIPRILMAFLTGIFIHQCFKKRPLPYYQTAIIGAVGSLLNTVLVLGSIALFKREAYMTANNVATNRELWAFLGSIVAVNGVVEAVASAILVSAILYALRKYLTT